MCQMIKKLTLSGIQEGHRKNENYMFNFCITVII